MSGWIALDLIVANPLARQGFDSDSQYWHQLAFGLPLTFGIDALTGGAYKLPRAVHAAVCAK